MESRYRRRRCRARGLRRCGRVPPVSELLALRTYTARLLGADDFARPARRWQHEREVGGEDALRREGRRHPREGLGLGSRDNRAAGSSRRADGRARAHALAPRHDRRADGQRDAPRAARRDRADAERRDAAPRRAARRASSITRTRTQSSPSPTRTRARASAASSTASGCSGCRTSCRASASRRRARRRGTARSATGRSPTIMVLERHGIFTFGETAKESYERMIEAVTIAERFAADRMGTANVLGGVPDDGSRPRVAAVVRGALATVSGEPPERAPIVAVRSSEWILAFLERDDAYELVQRGCATPDHVIRTKPTRALRSEARTTTTRRRSRRASSARSRTTRAGTTLLRGDVREEERHAHEARSVAAHRPRPARRHPRRRQDEEGGRDRRRHLRAHHPGHHRRRGRRTLLAREHGRPLRRRVLEPRAGQDQEGARAPARPSRSRS